ncbi:MAG: glycosyltransferase family 9 protein [Ginsengibacter sp.]|jgi:heptosyltransferase-2
MVIKSASDGKRFLMIRFSSIGDIVLTTPAIRCLRNEYPDAVIHFLTKPDFMGILKINPYLDKILLLKDDLNETIEEIRSNNYDCIIDLQHNLRSLKIKHGLKMKPFYSFRKLNVEKWIYTSFKINTLPDIHIVDRYIQAMKPLGVKNDGKGLDYFIPPEVEIKDKDLPFSHSQGFIAIVIGAAHNTKKLPVHKLISLVEKIQFPIILVGGKGDVEEGNQIAETDPVKIYNACGKFSLDESAEIIRRARLVISHDTGMMHIAAAFKKYILSVWGNTVPSFGMVPYMTEFEVFEVNKLWCRPCSKTGFEKCPLGHFKCMEKQDIDAIVASVNMRLGISM